MGDFQFNTDTKQIAINHGHSAFMLLRSVLDVETEHRKVSADMAVAEYGHADYLRLAGKKHLLTITMLRALVWTP